MADNPSAFPSRVDEPIPGGGCYRNDRPGMSLRDWFAGQMRAEASEFYCCGPGETRAQAEARYCYERADAMLAERGKSV